MRNLAITALVLLLISGSTAAQQTVLNMADQVPAGAMAYLETDDLTEFLDDLLAGGRGERLTSSQAWADFTRSKLFTKLRDRIRTLEEATGFGLSLRRLQEISGAGAALALYDIGELHMLLVSQVPMETVAASGLWGLRDRFETRGSGEDQYYVQQDEFGRVTLAFAFRQGRLLVGTDVLIFESALNLSDDESQAAEPGFVETIPSTAGPAVLRVWLDQKRIAETPYWRSYWLWDNDAELSDISAAFITLSYGDGEIVEKRWLTAENLPEQAAIATLTARLPANAQVVSAGAGGDSKKLAELVQMTVYGLSREQAEAVSEHILQAEPNGWAASLSLAEDGIDSGPTMHAALVISLADMGSLDRAALENEIAVAWTRKLLPEGGPALRFVDAGSLRRLDIPLFEQMAPAIRYGQDYLVFASSGDAARQQEDGDNPWQTLFSETGPMCGGMWIDLGEGAKRFNTLTGMLSGNDGWWSKNNAEFFSKNLDSTLKLLSPIDRLEMTRTRQENRIVEVVRYRSGS